MGFGSQTNRRSAKGRFFFEIKEENQKLKIYEKVKFLKKNEIFEIMNSFKKFKL